MVEREVEVRREVHPYRNVVQTQAYEGVPRVQDRVEVVRVEVITDETEGCEPDCGTDGMGGGEGGEEGMEEVGQG